MSVHKCPNCKDYGFAWQVDYDVSNLTIWDCWKCGYRAFEDESFESKCPDCEYAHRLRLEKGNTAYWWCTNCSTKTPAWFSRRFTSILFSSRRYSPIEKFVGSQF